MSQAIQILDLLIKIQESSDIFPHEWEATFDGINLLEVHCIDRIGKVQYANVTKIANEMEMTRGSISKICKRMISKGLIESYQRSDNHKEIYFRLTKRGQRVYNEHEKYHNQARQEELSLMNTFNEYEQSIIFRFLNGINCLHNRKMAEKNND
ncbi:MarR family transcriptional regulator [Sporomusa acidovorans]|uniref:HTH marR-type domain-containing protein n=1 Tax=Sporomusa acidovorans (strain ATCC 49682 / DSM 3132 / Mol) TaxID=1123286 RepID=A0ABZ3J4V4_SPOA4|nr:MarR family transcriptional regulator [Sporomusa acidovorans]OZC23545.1 MarR family protein [Sporomusa acidovorans DSM 3132]SDF46750.1 DNA-binding transcriptional regulator, MarR family [Sporomusa acidovorans]